MSTKPKVLISKCLLGENVRWDGGHKKDGWITNIFAKYVDFQGQCPEMEMGLASPRNSLSLVALNEKFRLVDNISGEDKTSLAKKVSSEYQKSNWDIDGAILKSKSPSCGIEKIKIFDSQLNITNNEGAGYFAQEMMSTFGHIPFIDEKKLEDEYLKFNFLTTVFSLWRFKSVNSVDLFLNVHRRHKYLIMSYSHDAVTKLGLILANVSGESLAKDLEQYKKELKKVLSNRRTKEVIGNTYQNLLSFFKMDLTSTEKKEILELINNFKKGKQTERSLNKLFIRLGNKHGHQHLLEQWILNPFPEELTF